MRQHHDAVLEEIIRQGQERDAQRVEADRLRDEARERRRRRPLHALVLLGPLLLGLTGWNVYEMTREQPVPFSPSEEDLAARFEVFVTASEIESYRREFGQLPASLNDLEIDPDAEVAYERRGNDFELRVSHRGGVITYRSGEPLDPYGTAVDVAADAAIAAEPAEAVDRVDGEGEALSRGTER